MADNIAVKDATGTSVTVRTTDNAGVHTPHHIVDSGTLTAVTAITNAVAVTDNSGSLTVDGTVTANLAAGSNNIGDVDVLSIAAGDNNIGNVDIVTVPAPLSSTGGGTEAAALRVTIATDSTGVLSVDDNGGALTVDANNLDVRDLAHTQDSIKVGDGTAFIDIDTAPTDGEVNGGKRLLHAEAWGWVYNGTTWDRLRGDSTNGALVNLGANNDVTVTGTVTVGSITAGDNNIGNVDVVTLPALAAGSNNIGDVDVLTVPAPLSTTGGGTEATALRVTVASDSTGVLSVDDNGGALTVDGTVTANLSAGTNTNEMVGDVAHSAGASGNPIMVAGASQNGDDTAPPNRVDAEGDATRFATDWDGAVYVRPHGPQVWSYHLDTSTAQTDASVHTAPGAGLSLYVGTIVFSSGAATAINLFFEEGASKVLGPYYLEATAGRGMTVTFNPPKKITANTALTLTTSANIAHCVDVTGFTAQG